ncbi:MAG TPA: CDP-diacylglycerol--glycerol-3-phosphate 3-phosphatidyltransferase [Acidimicrobiales bacterium]|jgi:cardiolipin synthase|nr:CDP-diacylglycerol--glycerol-3-phosphate 3-phosphatidyltransferase [Acidimicrobiales bacterium]
MEDGSVAAAADERPSSTAIVTLPNFITIVRLACLPVFLWLLFGQEDRAAAAWLLAALGITDWIDGYLARHLGQTSELGKILDPVADRLLFFVGAGGILIDGSVPVWFAVVVLARELLVAGATLMLAAMGAKRIDVTWWGKAGTFGLMVAFPLFLASHSDLSWEGIADDLAWIAAIPGLAFSLYAAASYVPIARRALAEGRAARQPAV